MRIILPENISDIKLATFQRYHELTTRTDLTEYQFNKRKIEIFTGLKQSDIRKIKRSDYEEINQQIDKALDQTVDFKPTFFIKDVEFGFINNLDDISAGEHIDLSKYGVDVATMHNLMAVLFRPITKKDSFGNYEIIEYEGTKQYADIMKHMPMNIVNGALVFFFEFSKRINELYPEIYGGGTSEGKQASEYFEKWGWFATIDELAKGKIWKMEAIERMNVHKVHLFLAHKIDKQKLKHQIMTKGNNTNTIEL